jgi:transposase
LAYEVLKGNTSDRSTLRDFLDKIEKTYGKAKRMWVMDRGIPSEQILREMREPAREIFYLVGTPKGKIQQTVPPPLTLEPFARADPAISFHTAHQ